MKGASRWTITRVNPARWECEYHVVFIPKSRRKVLYGKLRQYLGEVFRKLALQQESRIEQGHLMPDHVSDPNSRFERPHL